MIAGQPSATAERAAIRRASHQLLDDPKVFDDPIALTLVGRPIERDLRHNPRGFETPWSRPLRAFLAARSRYAEDALDLAVRRGTRQYVVLGAGLDSFAYRNPYETIGLRVVEVDCVATQAWKVQRLREVGIRIPDSVTFASHDFEGGALGETLARAGVDPTKPSFFAWLGVTPYLTPQSVVATLDSLSRIRVTGTEIVFDYCSPPSSLRRVARRAFDGLARRLRERGEPWIGFFDPASLERTILEMGFTRIETLGPGDIHARYFDGRKDGLTVGLLGHLAHVHA
jgi:methyltransferase (TIGR00027 family)